MKIVKKITLVISILFPIAITIFLGFYSYGAIGGWTINQTKFIESIFNDSDPTTKRIEEYIKFSSSHYADVTSQLNVWNKPGPDALYKDYTKVSFNDDGSFYSYENAFKVKSYVLANEDEDYYGIHTRFMLYDINYGLVNPDNLYFICVQGSGNEEAFNNLALIITQFEADYKEYQTTGFATVKRQHGLPDQFNIVDKGAILGEDDNDENPRYAYSFMPNNDFPQKDENGDQIGDANDFTRLGSCSYAIIEVDSDGNGDGTSKVWMTGELNTIEKSVETFAVKSFAKEGYGPNTPANIVNAGYNSYIRGKLILQSVISLIISGLLAYLFYATWTVEETSEDKVPPRTGKHAENKK